MDEKNNNNLKPEEMYGGFPSDYSETFLPQSDQEPELVPYNPVVVPDKVSPEPAQVKPEPDIKQTEPPETGPIAQPKIRKSRLPVYSAVAVIILLFAAFVYFLYTNLSLSFINKMGFTEVKKEVPQQIVDESEQIQGQTKEENSVAPETAPQALKNDSMPDSRPTVNPDKYISGDESSINRHPVQTKNNVQDNMTETQKNEPVATKRNLTEQNKSHDNAIPQEQKHEQKQEQKPTRQNVVSNGVYTLEVYSTPSYDDAKDWVNKFGRRKLQSSIVPQRVRDQIVYKVRLGSFNSEEEARKTAINMGLSRSNIDRIR